MSDNGGGSGRAAVCQDGGTGSTGDCMQLAEERENWDGTGSVRATSWEHWCSSIRDSGQALGRAQGYNH